MQILHVTRATLQKPTESIICIEMRLNGRKDYLIYDQMTQVDEWLLCLCLEYVDIFPRNFFLFKLTSKYLC